MAAWDDREDRAGPARHLHPRVLRRGEAASSEDLAEAITDAWLGRAPRRFREQLLGG